MKIETVKPIPASMAVPTMWVQVTPRGSTASPLLTASRVNAVTPRVFPTTSPAMTPKVTELEKASDSAPPESAMPAFASANNGSMR